MKQPKQWRERHLYYFKCSDCGVRNRHSFKRTNQRKGICRKCRRSKVDPNQIPLFDKTAPPVV